MIVVVAEKRAVALDYARVLGCKERKEGFFAGGQYQVTWMVGHLLQRGAPEVLDPAYKRWSLDHLPIVPSEWPLSVRKDVESQLKTVARLFNNKRTKEIVCGTDAGREGEHIFRLVYQYAKCEKPVRRLWVSSLTDESIRAGFAALKPGSDYDGLAAAADCRDKADWLVGMNLTRATTLTQRAPAPKSTAGKKSPKPAGGTADVWSVGRVQTPTLALVVSRDIKRERFAKTPYREVHADLAQGPKCFKAVYHRLVLDEESGKEALSAELPHPSVQEVIAPTDDAEASAERLRAAASVQILKIDRKKDKKPAPALYDLSALQQDANRLWGWSAAQTLERAQSLYQKHKVLSYPRTDSRHVSPDIAATFPEVFRSVAGPYREHLQDNAGSGDLPKRFVDASKISDHHALLPTGRKPSGLNGEEEQLYDLVVRRFCMMWAPAWITQTYRIEAAAQTGHLTDLVVMRGTATVQEGYKALEVRSRDESRQEGGTSAELLGELREGQQLEVTEARVVEKSKKPPPPFTEATLLRAMETAGKRVADPSLADAMKERGLGTAATRAPTIERLFERNFLKREGKSVISTDKGRKLVASVHPRVRRPDLTGEWERKLLLVERGELKPADFLEDVTGFVRDVVREVKSAS